MRNLRLGGLLIRHELIVPTLRRGNAIPCRSSGTTQERLGRHSHAGAWGR